MPQALENVILRATAKEPADRYKSAEEMSDDLSTVLSPARANEEKWQPHVMDNETKVITPLTEDAPMPDSFKSMPLPKDKPENETLPEEEEVLPDPKRKDRKMVADPISYSCCFRNRNSCILCFWRARRSCCS